MIKKILIFLTLICTIVFVSCSPKTVKNKEITINLSVGERVGYYTGEVNNGVPNGIGKFETENAAGVKWAYEGEFKDGTFNGEGRSVWEDGQTQEGTFKNGELLPNSKQLFEFFESQNLIHINSKAKQFLSDHLDFFPVNNFDTISDYIDENLSYKMLTKEINEYGNKVMKIDNLRVGQIFADDLSIYSTKCKFTCILAIDDELNNIYELFYIGSLDDIYDGDIIKNIYGIPLGLNSFENKGGSTTNTVQIAICYIDQIDEIETNADNENNELESDENLVDEDLKNVEVTYEIQDVINNKQKVVMYINNNSDKVLNGNLSVYTTNNEGKSVGNDMIFVEDLKVGNSTYAILWFEPSSDMKITYNWSSVEFAEDNLGSAGELDTELTDKMVNDYLYYNFGGGGNPDYATSWYDSILKVEVYKTDDEYYVEITTNQEDEEKRTTICDIGWQFKTDDVVITKVILLNENGEVIQEKSNPLL